MNGVIVNFRSSKHTQKGNYMVVIPEGSDRKEKAAKFVGKTAIWESPAKKQIKGKITAAHGNSGAVRVLFEKGMPGQSVGAKVKIE
jgi:large subunit ribosomal protein L35Ae